MTIIVLKLGGSLLETGRLRAVLTDLAAVQAPLALVPGGGPFADAVRRAQAMAGFSDALAHRLALRAMECMADVIHEIAPGWTMIETPDQARGLRRALWRCEACAVAAPEIPPGWDVTSDSLALWFAAKARARAAILVKSTDGAASDLVDSAFPRYAALYGGRIRLIGPKDHARLGEILDEEAA